MSSLLKPSCSYEIANPLSPQSTTSNHTYKHRDICRGRWGHRWAPLLLVTRVGYHSVPQAAGRKDQAYVAYAGRRLIVH